VDAHRAGWAAFGPEDDEAAHDEGSGHHGRGEQVGLDGLAQQQSHDDRRQKTDQHIEGKTLGLGTVCQPSNGAADFLPVDQDHREDRTGLDGDVEDFGLVVVKAQQASSQDQVPSGRNRQKFGQSFDHAHDGGFDEQ